LIDSKLHLHLSDYGKDYRTCYQVPTLPLITLA